MLSHVTLLSKDLVRAGKFYDAVLSTLGFTRRSIPNGGPPAACWDQPGGGLPRFYIYVPPGGGTTAWGNGSIVGFQAPYLEAVAIAYHAGLAHGGTDDGPPEMREQYDVGYYRAYIKDPDGNKIHIVYRGKPHRRDLLDDNRKPFAHSPRAAAAKSPKNRNDGTNSNARTDPQP